MRRQKGYSLIELMVALSLGLVIAAAALQLFVANQITFNFQRGMNDVQANGRFALDQLVRSARLSGLNPETVYTGIGSTPYTSGVVFAATEIPGLAPTSTAISSNNGTAAGLANSDQIVLRYFAEDAGVDCQGNTYPAGSYVLERYFVRTDAVTNTPALACDGGHYVGAVLTNYPDNGEVLVSGVESFQVMYGIDNGQNGVALLNQYVNAAGYNAIAPARAILSIRIGLYLRSQERAGDAQPPGAPVQVLDSQIAASAIPNDGMIRRLFVTTVALRNVNISGI